MYALGVDFGTSGARAILIDGQQSNCFEVAIAYSSKNASKLPDLWKDTLFKLLNQIPATLKAKLDRIAINGTSSTVLLCDRKGHAIAAPLMYNQPCPPSIIQTLNTWIPANHLVLSRTSSLAKMMYWSDRLMANGKIHHSTVVHFLHQADWLAAQLHGNFGISDYHNSLKLGYDPGIKAYPAWFKHSSLDPIRAWLPQVIEPGCPIGPLQGSIAEQLRLPKTTTICAGTTDSIAAFLASGASHPGEAVTSLGSTIVLKLLSCDRIDQGAYGIYSHRLGNQWLVGGASNSGGAVLAHFFSPAELQQLSLQIDPNILSGLNYYPLIQPGERFPINDPDLQPCLEPRPEDPVLFLQGLLEGLARIEADGYQKLMAEGATPLSQVLTAGGGAQNATWTQLRQRVLGVPVLRSPQAQAAYGSALLAQGCLNF